MTNNNYQPFIEKSAQTEPQAPARQNPKTVWLILGGVLLIAGLIVGVALIGKEQLFPQRATEPPSVYCRIEVGWNNQYTPPREKIWDTFNVELLYGDEGPITDQPKIYPRENNSEVNTKIQIPYDPNPRQSWGQFFYNVDPKKSYRCRVTKTSGAKACLVSDTSEVCGGLQPTSPPREEPTPTETPTPTKKPPTLTSTPVPTSTPGEQRHTTCRYNQCVEVPGPGEDECQNTFDCLSPSPTPTVPTLPSPTTQAGASPTPTTTATPTTEPTLVTSNPTPTSTPSDSGGPIDVTPIASDLPDTGINLPTFVLLGTTVLMLMGGILLIR